MLRRGDAFISICLWQARLYVSIPSRLFHAPGYQAISDHCELADDAMCDS